jgi:hypothetical protein
MYSILVLKTGGLTKDGVVNEEEGKRVKWGWANRVHKFR